jgi:hypothetical protein
MFVFRQFRKYSRDLICSSFLSLVSFSFFARFAANNIPETGAKFGQNTKNDGKSHKNPTKNAGPKRESVQIFGAVIGRTFIVVIDFIIDFHGHNSSSN